MSGFDKIAKKTPTKKTASSTREAALVTDEIKTAVDKVIAAKAEIARLKTEQADNEEIVIGHVLPQIEAKARAGAFTNSLDVEGNDGSVVFITTDKFSVPQDEESQEALQNLLKDKYDQFFETKRSISINEAALKNEAILNKICKACEKAGLDIGTIFDVGDKITYRKGLNERQYQLSPEELAQFRVLVRQAKPSLKG